MHKRRFLSALALAVAAIGLPAAAQPGKTPMRIVVSAPAGSAPDVIARLVGEQFRVKFGQTQIWRILGGLGFSVQKPERRAIERDEDAVQTWKRKTWPALKKKPSAMGD